MNKSSLCIALAVSFCLLTPDPCAAAARTRGARPAQENPVVPAPDTPALNAGSGDRLQTYENPSPEELEDAARQRAKRARKAAGGARRSKKTTQRALPSPPAPNAPITMDDTIYGVLRHHRELRGMQEDREVMKHELNRAKRAFGPSIDIDATAGTAVINDSSTRRHDLYYRFIGVVDLSARLTQPIWDGFATRSRVRSAQSTLNSVVNRVFDTATTLSLDGIIAQIDLLRRRVIYALAEKNVETHRSILSQTQDRSSMGADTEADVTQAQSRLSRALSSLSEAQASLITAEDTYTRLTGLPASKNIQPVPMPPVLFEGPKQVLDFAEKNNPKIHAWIEDIRALQADKQLAESEFYPNINVQVGPTHTNRNRWDDRWTSTFEVVGNLRWNIFNSGMDVSAVKAAKARIRESRQNLYNLIDDLMLDIQTTWTNYLAAKDQYDNYSEAVKYNEFTRVAYLEQFQMGQRTLLDVLDAENELYNSSTQAETARGNILVGAYRLLALTGDLLPALKIDLKPLDLNPERDPKDPRENFDLGWFK